MSAPRFAFDTAICQACLGMSVDCKTCSGTGTVPAETAGDLWGQAFPVGWPGVIPHIPNLKPHPVSKAKVVVGGGKKPDHKHDHTPESIMADNPGVFDDGVIKHDSGDVSIMAGTAGMNVNI